MITCQPISTNHYSHSFADFPNFDNPTYTAQNTYDDFSRVQTSTYPAKNYQVTNNWNAQGYVKSITDNNGNTLKTVDSISRFGQEDSATYGNGVDNVRFFNQKTGRMTDLQVVNAGNGQLVNQHYEFDAIGNLKNRKDNIKNFNEDLTYDELNRLTGTATTIGNGSPTSVTVEYDELGNITYKSDVGTYHYDETACSGSQYKAAGPHAVSSISGIKNTSYCFDKNGNMLNGDGRNIIYNAFNKPTDITKGTYKEVLAYDADRSLVKRVDYNNNQITSTTILLGSFEETLDSATSTTTYKFYVGDFAQTSVKSTEQLNQAKVNYFHKDHLGSTVAITGQNATQANTQYFSYDAWGKRRNPTAEAVMNDLQYIALGTQLTNQGFTGHEQLDTVGLIHMGGRVYDPTIGRFISADPFIEAPNFTQSYNRYSYVMNNPLSYTDPTGYGNFISNGLNAIGNALGGIFKAGGKLLRGVGKGAEDLASGVLHAAKMVFRKLGQNQYLNIAVIIAASYFTYGAVSSTTEYALNASAEMCTLQSEIVAQVAGGTAAGFVGGVIGTRSLKGGFQGAIAGGITGGVNGYYGNNTWGVDRVMAQSITGGISSRITGGSFKTGFFTQLGVSTMQMGWQSMSNYTDELKLKACANDAKEICSYNVHGELDTAGTRGIEFGKDANGISYTDAENNVFTRPGWFSMNQEGTPHSYDWIPGATRFINWVGKVHDAMNSWNYNQQTGLWISRSEAFNTAFQVSSMTGMPIAGAYTATAMTAYYPIETIRRESK